MRKIILFLLGGVCVFNTTAQNPATVFTIANRTIALPCGTSCTTITAQVPHIKQTNSYVITNPGYIPFSYTTAGGTEVSQIYIDDTWSPVINPGFNFCFYGSTYSSLIMGSNSAITFDISRAGNNSGWSIAAGTGTIPNTAYAPSMIFGPYHDIDPSRTSTNKKIEWRVEGTAPKRRFIASYNDMPYFGSSCTTPRSTHQMVLYEGTGVVEVYIKDKPFCTSWNSGLTILGMQNQTRASAIAATGKNATVWGAAGMDSCFRFIPSSGTSRLKSAELVVNGTVVANADTSTLSAGVLNLSFPNVCPTADSTAYVIRVTYNDCIGDPPQDVVFTDTVFVKRDAAPALSLTKTDANCTSNGTITATTTGGGPAPKEYSINGGTTYQTSNVFTNVAPGTYNILVRNVGSTCTGTLPVTVNFVSNLNLSVGNGGSICRGASFSTEVGGNATSYSWTPTTGVSNPNIANPFFTPDVTTTYTVTGTLGTCTLQRTVTVTVFPGATANAGPDAILIAGDVYPMQASGSAGTYLWTPSTWLSAANILNPNASPAATTIYTLRVTTPQGCFATDDVNITVIPYCVKIMEAFTPNGDGINERWLITNGNCLKTASTQVFNRYGARVFESGDYKNTWDGTYEGKPLPDGTYYYIISFQLLNGRTVYLKGNLTILR
jgi:gliding motility-associated-like protein